ncbi:MAG: hypothetical protein V7L11_22805 [Nostoc sp.]
MAIGDEHQACDFTYMTTSYLLHGFVNCPFDSASVVFISFSSLFAIMHWCQLKLEIAYLLASMPARK